MLVQISEHDKKFDKFHVLALTLQKACAERGWGKTAHSSQQFRMSQMRLAKIKTPPPWGFSRRTTVCAYAQDRKPNS